MATVRDDSRDRYAELPLADLSLRFGPMPAWRFRTSPPPGTATETDVLRIHNDENRLCELVDGIMVEKDSGHEESVIAGRLLTAVNNFVMPRWLGLVTGEAGMMATAVRRVRIPDVAFVSRTRLRDRKVPAQPIPRLVPNLAVEVFSRGNTDLEMQTKLSEKFEAGVELVWLFHPPTQLVQVLTSLESCFTLEGSHVLTGDAVLTGFEWTVRTLFAGLDD